MRPASSTRKPARAADGRATARTSAPPARARPRRATTGRPADPGRAPGETPKVRGERTRRRVAESLMGLLEEGDPMPTAKAVAARAGVSVRLVFHHFEDMETLYRMVLDMQLDLHWGAVRDVDPTLPLAERVERTVLQRSRLFDAITPVHRAAVALSARREDIADALAETDGLLREWAQATFGPELGGAGRERRELLASLDAAASWEAWEHLRRVQRLSAPASRRAMARTLAALLS